MMNLAPIEIFFSQDSINNVFDCRSRHSDTLIGETLDDICERRCSISNIPTISVAKVDGRWVTADNRRLWVFRQLYRLNKCDTVPVHVIDSIPAAKMTSYNKGVSIDVRRGPGGSWHRESSVRSSDPTLPISKPPVDNSTTMRASVYAPTTPSTLFGRVHSSQIATTPAYDSMVSDEATYSRRGTSVSSDETDCRTASLERTNRTIWTNEATFGMQQTGTETNPVALSFGAVDSRTVYGERTHRMAWADGAIGEIQQNEGDTNPRPISGDPMLRRPETIKHTHTTPLADESTNVRNQKSTEAEPRPYSSVSTCNSQETTDDTHITPGVDKSAYDRQHNMAEIKQRLYSSASFGIFTTQRADESADSNHRKRTETEPKSESRTATRCRADIIESTSETDELTSGKQQKSTKTEPIPLWGVSTGSRQGPFEPTYITKLADESTYGNKKKGTETTPRPLWNGSTRIIRDTVEYVTPRAKESIHGKQKDTETLPVPSSSVSTGFTQETVALKHRKPQAYDLTNGSKQKITETKSRPLWNISTRIK